MATFCFFCVSLYFFFIFFLGVRYFLGGAVLFFKFWGLGFWAVLKRLNWEIIGRHFFSHIVDGKFFIFIVLFLFYQQEPEWEGTYKLFMQNLFPPPRLLFKKTGCFSLFFTPFDGILNKTEKL